MVVEIQVMYFTASIFGCFYEPGLKHRFWPWTWDEAVGITDDRKHHCRSDGVRLLHIINYSIPNGINVKILK
jgi:hypothetical protein